MQESLPRLKEGDYILLVQRRLIKDTLTVSSIKSLKALGDEKKGNMVENLAAALCLFS
jgi:hypothetical protein